MFKEKILSYPSGYQLFQLICGAGKMRKVITREYIRPCPGSSILDIGCGTADIRPYLGDAVSYTGIDWSEAYIAHNRAKYRGDPYHFYL